MTTVSRHVRPRVLEALSDTRVVVVQGARQVGKTTLLREVVAENRGRLVTFDDDLTRASAQADPVGFLRQTSDGLLAIDEVQRVPELVLALKLVVDSDPRPGRFLLTGSANLLRLPATEDSLAGRAESIELHGFSQGEIVGHKEQFVDRLLAGDTFLGATSDLARNDYLERAVAGAYPEALGRPAGRRRNLWLENYLARIVERDAPDVSNLQRLGELPLILRVLAARDGGELNIAKVASDTGIPASTLVPHLELLETLYLIQRIPAWSTSLSKRVVSRPKTALLDSGLAARLLNVSAAGVSPSKNGEAAGHLLEGFVAGELRRQLGWSAESARISHYRDRAGDEVDLIIESDDGRVAGIEVKASASIGLRDAKWLLKLRDKLGDRFVAGVILHTGGTSGPFGDRVSAVPMDVLWTA
ncbi:ATP-binding protein [Isoptericola sp. F-RaC21]|uniref:ATP-binding protein n=1 Tax=Isoptericola sp. F-RaC21 TaxID=3141452 RepID=UPI00315C239F